MSKVGLTRRLISVFTGNDFGLPFMQLRNLVPLLTVFPNLRNLRNLWMFFFVATNSMRIKIPASLIILICAVSVCAQDTKCNLKLAELPDAAELFGFRMGMTTAQLKQRVPQVVFGRADEFGVLKTSISPDFD